MNPPLSTLSPTGNAGPLETPRTSPGARVLVVIPTLNESRHIRAVLGQLMHALPPSIDSTFVVADGGSTDGTQDEVLAAMVAFSHGIDRSAGQGSTGQSVSLHLMHNPQRLQSAAVNLAVRRFGADADILVRCDAHAGYPPAYIERLVDSLHRTEADAVVVPMDSVGDTCLQRAIAWVSDTPAGCGGAAHRGGRRSGYVDHGHHAAFRLDSFRRAGGYDESFSHNEDAELDCRQRACGSAIWLDADIRLQYRPRTSLPALARQYFNYGMGRSRTARRHPGSLRARQIAVPAHMVLTGLTIAAAAWWPWALAWPLAYLAALAATATALAVRHRSLCALLAAPAAAVMHGAWAAGFAAGCWQRREVAWQAPKPASGQPAA